jgi:SAM-dependent methyltransferase
MHDAARNFTLFVRALFPHFFKDKVVLDVGSGDINGNNRFLFENCEYHGNDVIPARNVTIVSKTAALPFENNMFDAIISTECFEHDPEYQQSFQKIVSMLKDGGLFVFTCASTGRAEHGTRRTSPTESYGTIGGLTEMSDYYKNLTFRDLNESVDVRNIFNECMCFYNKSAGDLYFWGIKKNGNLQYINIPEYNQVVDGIVRIY